MSDYTPTTEEIADWWAHKGGSTASPYYASKLTKRMSEFDRWLTAHDAEIRADEMSHWAQAVIDSGKQGERIGAARAAQDTEEPEGEHVFIERYGMHHAKFGGIGGDATSLTITREAWKDMGEPDVLAVSWLPVEQEGETDGH